MVAKDDMGGLKLAGDSVGGFSSTYCGYIYYDLRSEEQEELRPVGVLARIGHGKHAFTIVSVK